MEQDAWRGIPIVVGVTGHRDIRPEDAARLGEIVRCELAKLQAACPHSTVALLCNLAAGADQLCARAALTLSMPLIGALPLPLDAYEKDFSKEELPAFRELLARSADMFVTPDTEGRDDGTRDYAYRQAGVYVARHCHVLLALWDGLPGKPLGCGTAETVDCVLSETYKSPQMRLHAPEDGVVLQIVTPRKKNAALPDDAFAVHLRGKAPDTFAATLRRTDAYNADAQTLPAGAGAPLLDGKTLDKLPPRVRRMHAHYREADALAMRFRNRYLTALRALSATGVMLMLAFLLYDEAASNLFLPIYALVAGVAFAAFLRARRGDYHRKYLEYRFLAELMRVQLSLLAGDVACEAGALLTRAQMAQLPWAHDALQALCIGDGTQKGAAVDIERVWIDDQLAYHAATCKGISRDIAAQRRISNGMMWLSVAFFLLVCAFEFVLPKGLLNGVYEPSEKLTRLLLMRDGAAFDMHSAFNILLGLIPAVTLFVSGYYGKLSLPRKLDDRKRMVGLFAEAKREYAACPDAAARGAVLTELAREELSEAGGWLSYCSDNQLDVLL